MCSLISGIGVGGWVALLCDIVEFCSLRTTAHKFAHSSAFTYYYRLAFSEFEMVDGILQLLT